MSLRPRRRRLPRHVADAFIGAGSAIVGFDNLVVCNIENLPEGSCFEEADCCEVAAVEWLTKDVDII